MITATTRLLDVLRESQGNCTDYRAGKLLGVSTSAVSRWRTGNGHMSDLNVKEACKLAGLGEADTWRWRARVGAEREKTPAGDVFRDLLEDFERQERNEPPRPGHLMHTLANWPGRAAAIVATIIFAGASLFPEKAAHAAFVAAGEVREVCILWLIRAAGRVRRRRRQLRALRERLAQFFCITLIVQPGAAVTA